MSSVRLHCFMLWSKESMCKRKNVQLCQQQVDSTNLMCFTCVDRSRIGPSPCFHSDPNQIRTTQCKHEKNTFSTGNTITAYRYRVYVSYGPVSSKFNKISQSWEEKTVWNVECLVVGTHSNYWIEPSVSPVSENRIQQVRNEPRQQGSLIAHTRTTNRFAYECILTKASSVLVYSTRFQSKAHIYCVTCVVQNQHHVQGVA